MVYCRLMDASDRLSGGLRIALLAPPMLPVPPPTYAGTERVVAALGDALIRRGHDVTLFAPGDSEFEGRVVATVDNSLWRSGYKGDVANYIQLSIARAWREHDRYDVIHAHVETTGFLFARHCPTPVLTTLHGRLDAWGVPELLEEFGDIPLVAISDSQRRWNEEANWIATIHHGLPLDHMPFGAEPGDYLALVGRVTAEKGVEEAISLARDAHLTLRMAAKVYDPQEKVLFRQIVQPAIDEGVVEFLGEVGPLERDPLYAGALATVMLGGWPEPFGLVAIESLATGTPVIGRRAGALTETIEHGVDGFLVDDLTEAKLALERVGDLDRAEIRRRALERFSPDRMAADYERVYRSMLVPEPQKAPVGAASRT